MKYLCAPSCHYIQYISMDNGQPNHAVNDLPYTGFVCILKAYNYLLLIYFFTPDHHLH